VRYFLWSFRDLKPSKRNDTEGGVYCSWEFVTQGNK
jgi:hypothetical protein